MNQQQRGVRPAFHGPRPNQHRPVNAHGHRPHSSPNIVRPKPPSYSVAPWEVTQWIDPVRAQNTKPHK